MRKTIMLALFLSLISFSFANNSEFYNSLIDKGNLAYDEGKYDSSITFYSQVVNADFQSATLFYNLGNAYYKNQELAPAIFYYERALKLTPSDPDIKFNINMANQLITDKIQEKPVAILTQAYQWVSTIFTLDQWCMATIIFLIMGLVFMSVYLLTQNVGIKRLSFFGAIGLFALHISAVIIGQMVKNSLNTKNNAIVFTGTLTVKSEPKINSSALFVIHEGTKVTVFQDGETWLRIALPDGNEGWAKAEDLKTY